MPERKHIRLPHTPPYFSDGVLVGDTLYLAGRIGFVPGTRQLAATFEEEVRLIFKGFEDTLAQAGMTLQDFVYLQVFAPDLSVFEEFNRIYMGLIAEPRPARAFLGSGPLIGGAHVEVQGIAVKRS